MNDILRLLTEGSIWLDAHKRTIVVLRIHFANAATVGSYELLIIPSMRIVKRPASYLEGLIKNGTIQFCRECERES